MGEPIGLIATEAERELKHTKSLRVRHLAQTVIALCNEIKDLRWELDAYKEG